MNWIELNPNWRGKVIYTKKSRKKILSRSFSKFFLSKMYMTYSTSLLWDLNLAMIAIPCASFSLKCVSCNLIIVLGFSWNISLHLLMNSFFFFTSVIPLTFCVIICNWSFFLVTGLGFHISQYPTFYLKHYSTTFHL